LGCGVGEVVLAGEVGIAHGGVHVEAERVGEDRWWCLADELEPGAGAGGEGGDAGVVQHVPGAVDV